MTTSGHSSSSPPRSVAIPVEERTGEGRSQSCGPRKTSRMKEATRDTGMRLVFFLCRIVMRLRGLSPDDLIQMATQSYRDRQISLNMYELLLVFANDVKRRRRS